MLRVEFVPAYTIRHVRFSIQPVNDLRNDFLNLPNNADTINFIT